MNTVAAAFENAAVTYAAAADLQQEVALALAEKIAALGLQSPRVLEIGCGTGFLTRALAPRLEGAWTVTDISPAMVREASQRLSLSLPEARFKVMDGQVPAVDGPFDLICASLVFQWFDNLSDSFARLGQRLGPGGILAFTTLGPETFKEWRAVCRSQNVAAIPRAFSGPGALAAATPPGFVMTIEQEIVLRPYDSGLDFLDRLRAIGAHRGAPAARPLGPGALRRVLRATEEGFTTSYHVITGVMRRR